MGISKAVSQFSPSNIQVMLHGLIQGPQSWWQRPLSTKPSGKPFCELQKDDTKAIHSLEHFFLNVFSTGKPPNHQNFTLIKLNNLKYNGGTQNSQPLESDTVLADLGIGSNLLSWPLIQKFWFSLRPESLFFFFSFKNCKWPFQTFERCRFCSTWQILHLGIQILTASTCT